jgi:ABC-2 type transport system ATP-binding protein
MITSAVADGAASPEAGPVVEASGLRKAFGSVVAVAGVSLSLASGRIYGILGPNGSGKTTLLRLLLGLARPDAGVATVLGRRIPSIEVLAQIGYLPQGEGLYPDLTVWEQLRFIATLYGPWDPDRATAALELVGLTGLEGHGVAALSGGQRRRLSLACALVHAPRLLVLDEPTVGVDPALRVQFWAHFRRLARDGVTILVSSHVMDEADRCDELLFLRGGRLIAQGTPGELRASAGTADLEEAFLRLAGEGLEGSGG